MPRPWHHFKTTGVCPLTPSSLPNLEPIRIPIQPPASVPRRIGIRIGSKSLIPVTHRCFARRLIINQSLISGGGRNGGYPAGKSSTQWCPNGYEIPSKKRTRSLLHHFWNPMRPSVIEHFIHQPNGQCNCGMTKSTARMIC